MYKRKILRRTRDADKYDFIYILLQTGRVQNAAKRT